MNQERSQGLILAIVILACVGVGAIFYAQSQRAPNETLVVPSQGTPMGSVPSTSTGSSPGVPSQGMTTSSNPNPGSTTSSEVMAPVIAGEEIAYLTVNLAGSTIRVSHRCINGKVTEKKTEWNGETYHFCVGRNQLVIRDGGKDLLVDDQLVTVAQDAPLLIKAEQIMSSSKNQSGLALISYHQEVCTTTDNCGVGMPINYVSHLYTLETHKARRLLNYPEFTAGSAVWNRAFTKALFYPVTCGGAGCTPTELIGYNLETDFLTKVATTERAASLPEATEGAGALSDAAGNRLPYWSQIEWTTENDFRASITEPSERTRIIKGRI